MAVPLRLFFVVIFLLTMTTVSSRAQGGAQVVPGDIFVTDFEAGTGGRGALFLINRATGARTLISDWGNASQGPTGQSPFGLAIADANTLLAIDTQGNGSSGAAIPGQPSQRCADARQRLRQRRAGPDRRRPDRCASDSAGRDSRWSIRRPVPIRWARCSESIRRPACARC